MFPYIDFVYIQPAWVQVECCLFCRYLDLCAMETIKLKLSANMSQFPSLVWIIFRIKCLNGTIEQVLCICLHMNTECRFLIMCLQFSFGFSSFRNLNKVSTHHRILVSIRILQVVYPGFFEILGYALILYQCDFDRDAVWCIHVPYRMNRSSFGDMVFHVRGNAGVCYYSQEEVLHYFMVVLAVAVWQETGSKHDDGIHSIGIVALIKKKHKIKRNESQVDPTILGESLPLISTAS